MGLFKNDCYGMIITGNLQKRHSMMIAERFVGYFMKYAAYSRKTIVEADLCLKKNNEECAKFTFKIKNVKVGKPIDKKEQVCFRQWFKSNKKTWLEDYHIEVEKEYTEDEL